MVRKNETKKCVNERKSNTVIMKELNKLKKQVSALKQNCKTCKCASHCKLKKKPSRVKKKVTKNKNPKKQIIVQQPLQENNQDIINALKIIQDFENMSLQIYFLGTNVLPKL